MLRKDSESRGPQSPLFLCKRMDIRSKIADLAGSSLGSGQFLVDVVASTKNLSKITVIIDGDQGVTIDDCGMLSRLLSTKLDELDFGTSRYVLEVTTPGLDHPLKLRRQFHKNIGRQLKVLRRDKSLLTGKLNESSESHIVLKQEVKEGKTLKETEVPIPFDDIEKAFVVVSFK